MKSLNVLIQEPFASARTFDLLPLLDKSRISVGRAPHCDLILKDPTLPPVLGEILIDPSSPAAEPILWFKRLDSGIFRLGDLLCRESHWPFFSRLQVGETQLTLTHNDLAQTLPRFPAGARAWHTTSSAGSQTLWTTHRAAQTHLSTYLCGETGVGKDILAQLLHLWSPRASGPFVPLHCAAVNLSLAESELFGHVKGAFTGAISNRPGALKQAHNGTLFLDEIGDLPTELQVKLLRFLENGEIRPVGADQTTRANVRLICATHRSLLKLVEEGKFRRDLYFRLASITIEIPPLRERPHDIEYLARRFAGELGKELSSHSLFLMKGYPWLGNVRELRHCIERSAGLAGPLTYVLDSEHFPHLKEDSTQHAMVGRPSDPTPILTLHEIERNVLVRTLRLTCGNRAETARLLGVARSTVFEMIRRHRIKPLLNYDFIPPETG